MIDDKKIEEAAFEEYPLNSDGNIIGRNGFKEGAKWAINEFLKDLWHPASEEPKGNSNILFKTADNWFDTDSRDIFSWKDMLKHLRVVKWLYIDDLLPKKGGEK